MTAYTQNDIERYYARIKRMAVRDFEKGEYVRSLRHIDNAASLAYNLNHIYADPELEALMGRISEKLVDGEKIRYPVVAGRWLFYDQIGNDTVLALQYIRALMEWGGEILYVLDPMGPDIKKGTVISELESYGKATILILDTNMERRVDAFHRTLAEIMKFGPEKALIHAPAGGAFGVAMLHALKDTVKYRIVPGDHHFYLGTSVTDYAIEFRPFGATVAMEKRGMKRERILIQPYYPVVMESPFEGFDFDAAGKTLLFSGGAYYKILGGDEIYFRIIKRITDTHPEVIVQYNGQGTARNRKKVKELINKYGLERVFHLDDFRPDVNEIMKRCDIYIGTYPLCGGLMSQYAAINGKPVLQYRTLGDEVNFIEDILGVDDPKMKVSFTDIDALVQQAEQFIESPTFRHSEGEKLRRAMITPRRFASRLKTTVENGKTFDGRSVKIDYPAETHRYLTLINEYSEVIENLLVRRYRIACVWLFSKAALKFFGNLPRVMLKTVITKRGRAIA